MPVLPLVLRGPSGAQTPPIPCLVDSGASSSLFPAPVAQLVGVDLTKCDLIDGMTAGGVSKRYRCPEPLQAELMGRTLNLHAEFEPNLPIVLLGRTDFFTVFKVAFDERKRRFTLTPY